jgi:hypothetical protein
MRIGALYNLGSLQTSLVTPVVSAGTYGIALLIPEGRVRLKEKYVLAFFGDVFAKGGQIKWDSSLSVVNPVPGRGGSCFHAVTRLALMAALSLRSLAGHLPTSINDSLRRNEPDGCFRPETCHKRSVADKRQPDHLTEELVMGVVSQIDSLPSRSMHRPRDGRGALGGPDGLRSVTGFSDVVPIPCRGHVGTLVLKRNWLAFRCCSSEDNPLTRRNIGKCFRTNIP